jgi:hypothetical protein
VIVSFWNLKYDGVFDLDRGILGGFEFSVFDLGGSKRDQSSDPDPAVLENKS